MAEIVVIPSDDDEDENGASNSNSKMVQKPVKLRKIAPNGLHSQEDSKPVCLEQNNHTALSCFDEFINLCRKQTNDPDFEKIIPRLKKKFAQANKEYTQSKKFQDFMQSLHTRLEKDSKCLFVHVKELSDELTAYKVKSKPQTLTDNQTISKTERLHNGISKTDDSKDVPLLPSTSSSISTSSKDQGPVGADCKKNEVDARSKKNELAIAKYEKLLAHLGRKIKKLEERELNVDDLDDDESTYILEDRLKKRFMEVWERICKLKGRVLSTGRATDRTFNYEGSRYPEINRRITRFLNKNKQFPDFADVLELVERVIDIDRLPLKSAQAYTEAQTVFTDVGKMLRANRLAEFDELLCSGDAENDPATKDEELAKTLNESAVKAQKKIEEVFNTFAQKQHELENVRRKVEGESDTNERCATPDGLRADGGDDDESGESEEEVDDKESEEGHFQKMLEEMKDEVDNDELDAGEQNTVSNEESDSEEEATEYVEDDDEEESVAEVYPVACHTADNSGGDCQQSLTRTRSSSSITCLSVEVPTAGSEDVMELYREHSDKKAQLSSEQAKNCSPVSIREVRRECVSFGSVKRELDYSSEETLVIVKRLRTECAPVVDDNDVITISDSD